MNNFCNIVTKQCQVDKADFWKALEIWLKNPHLINRRILSSTKLYLCKIVDADNFNVSEWFESVKNHLVTVDDVPKLIVDSITRFYNKNVSIETCSGLKGVEYFKSNNSAIYLQIAKLLPRHPKKFSQTLEVSFINVKNCSVTQFFYKYNNSEENKILGFDYPCQIQYDGNNIYIQVQHPEEWKNSSNLIWLQENFFPKIFKWIVNENQNNNLIDGSLQLVPCERYNNLYTNLKVKYGKEMVKMWPENTDPLKFVYEDIAIASYLLLLWELEREKLKTIKKQSFLDLGCGNGLLVHILNSEGYNGFGIDLRKRKIWDLYPVTTKLEVQAIVPSSKCLFPEIDWLIGNHSDELTPWIPVIAARSSYKCRFFLLPCCAYEFDGKKYQRESATFSQYYDYMLYIKKVSENCGFKINMDKLRIPSTKRICLIGTERNYLKTEMELQDKKIQEMINSRCCDNQITELWSSEFKPREAVEKVRNCTQVDKEIISNIIETVVSLLLKQKREIKLEETSVNTWNAGGEIELPQLATIIDQEKLKELKKECGGLQTLLKNNGHIFRVESGKVRFRVPGKDKVGSNRKSNDSKIRKNTKMCWFYVNHPDGCPLTDINCDFKHS